MKVSQLAKMYNWKIAVISTLFKFVLDVAPAWLGVVIIECTIGFPDRYQFKLVEKRIKKRLERFNETNARRRD